MPRLVNGQQRAFYFQQIPEKEDLSQATVNAILRDRIGFMWFGTEDGLNLYDGYGLRIFKHVPGNPQSISNSQIWSLYEDSEGILWIGTFNGLNRYDRHQDSFTSYLADQDIPGTLSNGYVRSITEDQQGNLWVGTHHGINRFDEHSGTFRTYLSQPEAGYDPNENVINAMVVDHLGNLWVGTQDGLKVYVEKSDSFLEYNLPGKYRDNKITALFEDREGDLWIGTGNHGVFKFDRRSSGFIPVELERGDGEQKLRVTSITEDEKGAIWVGTYNGLYRLDENTREVLVFHKDYLSEHALNDNDIKSLFADNNGFIWVGTVSGGVNLINPALSRFGHVTMTGKELDQYQACLVRSLAEDNNGNLLVGTRHEGLMVYDPESSGCGRLPGRIGSVLENHYISAILAEGEEYWFGLKEHGLIRYDVRNDQIREYSHELEKFGNLNGNVVLDILRDSQGLIWFGTNGDGIYEYNPESGVFKHHIHDPQDKSSISHNRVHSMIEDHLGNLWIATAGGGLNMYSREEERFISYNKLNGDTEKMEYSFVISVLEDSSGDIWAGTFGGGLIHLSRKDSTVHIYSEKNGLKNNVVYAILEDDYGHLWLSHNQGITRFDTKNGTFRDYDARDGLQGNEFFANAAVKCSNGQLVFGGTNGFNMFHPDRLEPSHQVPPVVFTRLKISNREVTVGEAADQRVILDRSLVDKGEIHFHHSDREIAIWFAALDYSVPGKNQYRYKLEERDTEWIPLGTTNQVSFHSLPEGRSTLHVQGSNSDGTWNEEGAVVTFLVKPPFYRTFLFYTILLLILFGLIILLYTIRMGTVHGQKRELELLVQSKTREIRRQRDALQIKNEELETTNQSVREERDKTAEMARQLEEANQSKLQFFTNISHEFRTPLTLILGYIEKLQDTPDRYSETEKNEDYLMIGRNASRLLRLINKLLQFRKVSVPQYNLKVSEQDLVEFVRNQAVMYRNLADKKGVNFTFESNHETLMAWFDQERLEDVVNNLYSNAFKFTPDNSVIRVVVGEGTDRVLKGMVDEPIQNPDQYLFISVEDHGVGIPVEKQSLVFDRFYQVDEPGSGGGGRRSDGGIGLNLSQRIIQLHEGRFLLKSAPGEGAVFTVMLRKGRAHLENHQFVKAVENRGTALIPEDEVAVEQVGLGESGAITQTFEQLSKKDLPRVLVIEDNHELRRFILQGLGAEYSVMEAESVPEARKLMEGLEPEVIVCDVMLPGELNGFDFVEQVKTDINTSHIPVILLTALDSEDQKILGLEKGADIYMTKPFSMRELRVQIQNTLHLRQVLKNKFREQAFLQTRDLEITDQDETFLQKTLRIIEAGMSDPQFNVSSLCETMNMSQTKLYRKIKALTDMTITDFIRGLRLRKASLLLLNTDKNISEIAYEVGFNDPNYFGKCFRAEFGKSPSEFAKEQGSH
ncbi:MAG: two-component regulator propeller domain-containing protein [Bacteroidota bacterium]